MTPGLPPRREPGARIHSLPIPAEFHIEGTTGCASPTKHAYRLSRQQPLAGGGVEPGHAGQNKMVSSPAIHNQQKPEGSEGSGENGAAAAGGDDAGASGGGIGQAAMRAAGRGFPPMGDDAAGDGQGAPGGSPGGRGGG